MPHCKYRVPENHARSRITHNLPDAFPFCSPVAVNRAIAAGRLPFAVRAVIEPSVGIGKQCGTLRTQSTACRPSARVLSPTVDVNHQINGSLVRRDAPLHCPSTSLALLSLPPKRRLPECEIAKHIAVPVYSGGLVCMRSDNRQTAQTVQVGRPP